MPPTILQRPIAIFKRLAYIIYKAGDNGVEHDGIEHAGYLSFLGLLTLFPFLVFLMALTGLIGQSSAGLHFINFLFDNLPPHLVDVLRPRVQEIVMGPPQGFMTLAFVGAIWTSSSAVEGYRTVLNRAYCITSVPNYWYRRVMAILQLFFFSVLLIGGMLMLVVVPVAQEQLPMGRDGSSMALILEFLSGSGVRLMTLAILIIATINIHYILPSRRQRLRWLIPGAVVTGIGWMFTADLFSTYLSGVNRINLIYGSLGGIIAVLLFFYVANLIFIYGAEFNYLLHRWYWEHNHTPDDEDDAIPDA
jgi:membrane protein